MGGRVRPVLPRAGQYESGRVKVDSRVQPSIPTPLPPAAGRNVASFLGADVTALPVTIVFSFLHAVPPVLRKRLFEKMEVLASGLHGVDDELVAAVEGHDRHLEESTALVET